MLLDLGDLRVRSWRKDDLDALLRHANNPKIAANLRDQFPHPYTRRDAIEYLNYVRSVEIETSFAVEYRGRSGRRHRLQAGHWTSPASAPRLATGWANPIGGAD